MAKWIRFEQAGKTGFGTLEGDSIAVHTGDLFAGAKPSGEKLKLSDVHLAEKNLYVNRLKKGISTTHPLYNGEVKAIKDWLAKRQEMTLDPSGTLFISEQCRPLSRSMVHRLVQRYARAAGLADLNVHPHMLRHACGYDLANRGIDTRGIQGYLGHSNIQHTVRYTALSPHRFANYY